MESKEAREWELQDKSEKPVKCETTTERAGGETAACIPAKRYIKILGELTMDDLRKECPMRHENGNCTVIGGFCTAVNDPICLGLHNAYELGCYNAALRLKQEPKFYEHAPVKQYDGLKQKYLVIKADTGELVKNCFVLRPDRDLAAVTALRAYVEATDNETLAADIINWVGADGNAALTQEDLNRMHFDKVWLSYGSDPDHGEDGEWAVVIYGQIYSIETLDGSGFEELLKDSSLSGETLDNPSGQYKVYRRPSGTI